MDKSALTTLITQEVKGLSVNLAAEDYSNAIDDALRETAWSLPVTVDFKIYWLKQRAKRHLFFYLMSESAHKFKVKQLALNQRFDHYKELIVQMDKDFLAIIDSQPEMFTELLAGGVDTYKLFGQVAGPGFEYDEMGNDITDYDDPPTLDYLEGNS
jgi:hypothetical protein